MSDRYVGGIIKGDGTEVTTSRFGTNSGMFTLGQQLNAFDSGNWPSDYDVALELTESGSWECPSGIEEIDYLVVAGGGGGSTGGGGAGGLRIGTGLAVIPNKTYPISIGSGGSGAPSANPQSNKGGNGVSSAFETEANVRYYVSVGNPGVGNRYYIKTEQTDSVAGNVAAVTQKLYEGSTYVFDQSHPTNSGHPFRFSETPNGTHNSPGTEYTTGVTTNQPSVAAGSPGSAVQIQVASPAPQLYYYCSVHPNMGGAANTLANVTVKTDGGGGGGADGSHGHTGGSGGGGGLDGSAGNWIGGGNVKVTSLTSENTFRGSTIQGFNGGSRFDPLSSSPYTAAGGGGASESGQDNQSNTVAGNGGNGIFSTISGTSLSYGGGGGGGVFFADGGAIAGIGGLGGGGNGTAGPRTPSTPTGPTDAPGDSGVVNTGGGGGGCGYQAAGNDGGSGVVFIKYKNKINNRVFKFNGTGVWKNDFGANQVEYLVVAGAGGAGCDNPFGVGGGAGGGAGGFRTGTLPVTSGQSYTVTVGAGGAGSPTHPTNGSQGTNSIFDSIKSIGGGGGGSRSTQGGTSVIRDGGSGGGSGQRDGSTILAGKAVTGDLGGALQGNNGGEGYWAPGEPGASGGGGGGGAGSNGQASFKVSSTYYGGNGGDAIASDITGSTIFYAGGGGGASHPDVTAGRGSLGGNTSTYLHKGGGADAKPTSTAGEDGISNTGGGGGAGGPVGGTGGSGVVIIKITG